MKARVVVNRHHVKWNETHPEEPRKVLSIHRGKRVTYADTVEVLGPAKLVYRPCSPMSCGARVWLETDAAILADGEEVKR